MPAQYRDRTRRESEDWNSPHMIARRACDRCVVTPRSDSRIDRTEPRETRTADRGCPYRHVRRPRFTIALEDSVLPTDADTGLEDRCVRSLETTADRRPRTDGIRNTAVGNPLSTVTDVSTATWLRRTRGAGQTVARTHRPCRDCASSGQTLLEECPYNTHHGQSRSHLLANRCLTRQRTDDTPPREK